MVDSPFPSTATNPNHSKPAKSPYPVAGIQVEFPYQPYGTQRAFMGRVISTLDRAVRDGHCHALLESPTGTGKSLSLLCSTLAWQQNFKLKNQYANLTHSVPNPEAISDPLAHGGGFIAETQDLSVSGSADMPTEPAQGGPVKSVPKKKITPTIYYASRTHSQLTQVIREFKKTSYRVPMAVLASRKHYCTNKHVNGKENIDEECKLLLKEKGGGCAQFKNANKLRAHPSLQKGGCHEVHDIEDLVKVGKVVKGCPYYAARSMADDALLVFCPYSYIINPVIRGAMEVDINKAILILDEAHNIEDISREAGSVDVEEDILYKLQMELQQLCLEDPAVYQPLYEMAQDLLCWIERRKNTLEKRDFQHYFSSWTGDKALRELQEANISQQCFPILLECATKAIKAATDAEAESAHNLSGLSVITLESLFSSFTYFFSRKGCHTSDFQLGLQRSLRKDKRNAVGDWTHTFSLWCLNPAVVFRDIADLSLSVILTSGTLSPMDSFSSELGVQFGTCLEAPHVIDVEKQAWAAVIPSGPNNYPLNASYKTADLYDFQDELGKSLEEICKIVPAGSLVFFPSYKLMEKLCSRWRETGQWLRLNARKPLFVEPRGGSQEDFESLLKDYYGMICGDSKSAAQKKRKGRNMAPNHSNASEDTKKGAAFLAVCRGKVSEGIDFSDDNARVVILVGIPFPNTYDIQVNLKKKYNDTYKASKGLLSGSDWYCNQAFRALNQAAGRCIRHRLDYGAVILLDQRYQEERNVTHISKWLKKSIRKYDNFNGAMDELKLFFRDAKEYIRKNTVDLSLTSEVNDKKNILPENQSTGWTRNKSQKLKISDHFGRKAISLTKRDVVSLDLKSKVDMKDRVPCRIVDDDDLDMLTTTIDLECESPKNPSVVSPELKSKVDMKDRVPYRIVHDDDLDKLTTVIDLECESPKDSRSSEACSNEDEEITVIKETPGLWDNRTMSSRGVFCKDGNCSSTVIDVPLELTGQAPSCSVSLTNPSRAPHSYRAQCSTVATPDREPTLNVCSLIPEAASYINLSRTRKQRKSFDDQLINITEQSDAPTPSPQTPGVNSFTSRLKSSRDIHRQIEFDTESKSEEHQCTKSNSPQSLSTDKHPASNLSCYTMMDKQLRISCSLCKSPLGLPENHLYVRCALTLSSKVYLASLTQEKSVHSVENTSTSTSVLMTDIESVNQRLFSSSIGDVARQGVWCKEDGCVFNSLFCPFCSTSYCLGLQVMAADALNLQLVNKVLFYVDRLEIENIRPPICRAPKDEVMQDMKTVMDKKEVLSSIEKFSYFPQQPISGGWRTTKTKLRLPRKGY